LQIFSDIVWRPSKRTSFHNLFKIGITVVYFIIPVLCLCTNRKYFSQLLYHFDVIFIRNNITLPYRSYFAKPFNNLWCILLLLGYNNIGLQCLYFFIVYPFGTANNPFGLL